MSKQVNTVFRDCDCATFTLKFDMFTACKMSLQWTIVATFLYSELFMCILFMLPFISATRYGTFVDIFLDLYNIA